MSKTVLITGGAGFIGSNFVHYYSKNHPDDKIINLDLLTYAGNLDNLIELKNNPNYKFIKGDITDKELVNKVLADVDLVVHFAAESHVDRSIMEPEVFVNTNVLGTQVLLESCLKNKVKHFHHISTDEVFGSLALGSQDKFDEKTSYDPRSPYSASKAASDHLVRAYGETFNLPFTITNCSNNYGEYQFPEKLFGLVITNFLTNKKAPVYGDGLNVRDWLYVQDHCSAIDLVINQGKLGETYLIGGLNQDIANIDIVKLIAKLMDKGESDIEFVKDRPGHDRRYAVDWNKISKELGWMPSVSFEEGLIKTINWYKENQPWWENLIKKNQEYFEKQYD
jgi:dTDP-glucose 4,6-dehydratase